MEALGKGVKGATKKGLKGAVKGLSQTKKVAAKTAKYAGAGVKKTGKMTGLIGKNKVSKDKSIEGDDYMEGDEEEVGYYNEQEEMYNGYNDEVSMTKANHILTSKGTHRLNRILRKSNNEDDDFNPHTFAGMDDGAQKIQKLEDPKKRKRGLRVRRQCCVAAPSN